MKKIFFLIGIFCFQVIANAQKQYVVDQHAEQRAINGSFHSIELSGGIELFISQSDKEEVAVSGSTENISNGIKTVVENNVLKIYYYGEKNWSKKNRKMIVYVAFKDIEVIDASGASEIFTAGKITVPSLFLKLSGASVFNGELEVNKLTLDLSGASDAKISGNTFVLNIESSGASDVRGYDLTSEICTANASGASDINITVNKELKARATGASDISFKGNAVIKDQQVTGASNISRNN